MQPDLLNLCIFMLLPIIPSYILYRTLPSRTKVTGPFKGLNIQLSGAFGGYFLLVVTMLAFRPSHRAEVYTVTGTVRLDAQSLNMSDASLILQPPPVNPDGKFRFDIPVKEGIVNELDFPTLLIQYPGYGTETLHLSEDGKYHVEYDKKSKTIKIRDPIVLQANQKPYSEGKGQTAEPNPGVTP
jgi:hypothetical protein